MTVLSSTADLSRPHTCRLRSRGMKRWLVVIVLFAACSGGGGSAAPTTTPTTAVTTTGDPHIAPPTAVDACHDAVKEQLSTTASGVVFSDPEVVRNDRLKVTIKGTLEVTNGLGAQVTVRWECDAQLAGGTEYQATAVLRPGP